MVDHILYPDRTWCIHIMGQCELLFSHKSSGAGQQSIGAPFRVITPVWLLVNHRDELKVVVGVCLFIRRSDSHLNIVCADKGACTLRKLKGVKWREVMTGYFAPHTRGVPGIARPLRWGHCGVEEGGWFPEGEDGQCWNPLRGGNNGRRRQRL